MVSKDREKICNICGEGVLVFSIMDNAPLCERCVPVKLAKKIPNAEQMIQRILKQ